MIGKTISHYSITEKIGAGGMGEVYRASDSRLGRDVALKVLPEAFAADPARLARFRREAQVLASLNHPNIATIYGIEESDGIRCLVMELVEGDTLADRLRSGPLPQTDALGIALQIAEALETAHDKGIVHRDLKPANVKVTPAGQAKVLDFGLAKAFEEEAVAAQADLSLSPTMTAAATRAGIILGTAGYMSPEQARGAPVDKRSDIWAFGCVLLEMLSGKQTFAGETVSDTLAAVLKTDPDWSSLPQDVPAGVCRLLRRCLDKDPRRRLRDIGEARIGIEALLSGTPEIEDSGLPDSRPAPRRSARQMMITLAAVVLTAAFTAALVSEFRSDRADPVTRKFEFIPKHLAIGDEFSPVLSPDGGRIVFVSDGSLWVRDLDQLEARPLAGTTGALYPFWSPNGEWVGYCRDGTLWKIPSRGGQSSIIAGGVGEFVGGGGVTWGEDDRIVFSRGNTGILEVSARGGDPSSILDFDPEAESDLHEPSRLPGDRGILFVAHRLITGPDTLSLWDGTRRKTLLQLEGQRIANPVFSPTGHILYRRQMANDGLWAVPFSLRRLEITGEPFLIDPEGSHPSVADDGTLLYGRGVGTGLQQMVWVNREGTIEGTISQPQQGIGSPAISPDGSRIAVMGRENQSWDIWIHDIVRETRSRLTFDPIQDWDPTWSPGGDRVVFWNGADRTITAKGADGTGEAVRLVPEDFPDSGNPFLSPDGKFLVFWVKEKGQIHEDLWMRDLEDQGDSLPLIRGPDRIDFPRLSPDGRYMAYTSNESGRNEIYITTFPAAKGKWQVSVNGGTVPRWGSAGGRLFYREDEFIMEVDVVTAPTLQLGTPKRLFSARELGLNVFGFYRFDVAPDGDRFIMVRDLKQEGVNPSLVLVQNWTAGFREKD